MKHERSKSQLGSDKKKQRYNVTMAKKMIQASHEFDSHRQITDHYQTIQTFFPMTDRNTYMNTTLPTSKGFAAPHTIQTTGGVTPDMSKPLDNYQVDHLLTKVNFNNTFLKMANEDPDLIHNMKETIEFQQSVIKKRDRLVKAICHNVQYLSKIHESNNAELVLTRERLKAVNDWNEKLQAENEDLSKKCASLDKSQKELHEKRKEIQKMVIDSQANAKEIEELHKQNEEKGDQMEKLNLEVQVVVTEKMAMKKELDRIDRQYNKIKKDFKEQRETFALMVDENTNLQKQNSQYRSLLLDNEEKFTQIANEIKDLQKHIDLKNKQIARVNDEIQVYQKQQEKLLEELREKSDSESFDDEKERILNVQKAMEGEQLKKQLANMKVDIKLKQQENDSNIKRLEDSLKFSSEANKNLKTDYDLLQEKFDKHMKVSNNLNQDLKEEIEELGAQVSKLQIFYDDNQEIMQGERQKADLEMKELREKKDAECAKMQEERDKMKKELEGFKQEFQMKMNQVKLMEMELEEKLADAQKDD